MKSLSIALKNLIKEPLCSFVFPAFCLHCKEEEIHSGQLLCLICQEWIQRAPLPDRLIRSYVAVQREGAPESLLQEIKGPLGRRIAKIMAGFMALQIIDLDWPSFDLIIPESKDLFSCRLAKEIEKILGRKIKRESFSPKKVLIVSITLSKKGFVMMEKELPENTFHIGFCST